MRRQDTELLVIKLTRILLSVLMLTLPSTPAFTEDQPETDQTFEVELTICPGKSEVANFKHRYALLDKEISSNEQPPGQVVGWSYNSTTDKMTVTAGANKTGKPIVVTLQVVFTYSKVPLGLSTAKGTFKNTYNIKVTVPAKCEKSPPGPGKPNEPGKTITVPLAITMCIGDSTMVTPGSDITDRKLKGFKLKNFNPKVASASFYVEKKMGKQTSAPIMLLIEGKSEGKTEIIASDASFVTPKEIAAGISPYEFVYTVEVKKCRVATGPGGKPEGSIGTAVIPGGYVPVSGNSVKPVPSDEGTKTHTPSTPGGGKPRSSPASPRVVPPIRSSPSPSAATGSIDPCLVGAWRTASVASEVLGSGGVGILVTFKSDGTQVVDYNGMQPIKGTFGGINQWSGSAAGHISTSSGTATIKSVERSDLVHKYTAPDGTTSSTSMGRTLGPAGLVNNPLDRSYTCTETTLTYKAPAFTLTFTRIGKADR